MRVGIRPVRVGSRERFIVAAAAWVFVCRGYTQKNLVVVVGGGDVCAPWWLVGKKSCCLGRNITGSG